MAAMLEDAALVSVDTPDWARLSRSDWAATSRGSRDRAFSCVATRRKSRNPFRNVMYLAASADTFSARMPSDSLAVAASVSSAVSAPRQLRRFRVKITLG
jgi:hypothetical protein